MLGAIEFKGDPGRIVAIELHLLAGEGIDQEAGCGIVLVPLRCRITKGEMDGAILVFLRELKPAPIL